MTLSYEDIFADFLGNISDYQLASLDESEAFQQMTEWFHKVLANTYVTRVFSEFSTDDEDKIFSYTLVTSVTDYSDLEFVKDILAKGMVVEWLSPQVRSKMNTAQMFGGKEQKFYAQSTHMGELRGLLEDVKLELRKMIRDRGYIYNSYLEES